MSEQNVKVIYTILPELGNAPWAWQSEVGKNNGVGPNIADGCGWSGQHPISSKLEKDFVEWAIEFDRERMHDPDVAAKFDWESFHLRGIELARQLKKELGSQAMVRYIKPGEDPSAISGEITKISDDGSLRICSWSDYASTRIFSK